MQRVFGRSSWPIHGRVTAEMIQIQSEKPLTVLTSAVVGGGLAEATIILNRHVDKSYCPPDPKAEIQEWLEEKGLSRCQSVVLLTAAYVDQGGFRQVESEYFRLAVWATAGVGNAARAGLDGPVYLGGMPGTINLILLVDGRMTIPAMVNSIITATEAKAAALQDLGVTDPEGNIATGTNTDAIVVASTQQWVGSYLHQYTGVASPLGRSIGQAVYQAVREAVENERKLRRQGRG